MKNNTSNGNREGVRDTSAKPARRYELDWLRVLVILNLISFHSAWMMTFVPDFSQISQSSVGAVALRYYVVFCSCWHMPLLFFIAGVASQMALRTRSVKGYLQERCKRLLVPLVFYMVFLGPILRFFWPDNDRSGGISEYFLDFLPKYLLTLHAQFNPNTQITSPAWHHLWFVAYLFLISIVTLPIYCYLNNRFPKGIDCTTSTFFRRKGSIYLFAFPLIVILIGLAPLYPLFRGNLYGDWAYFSYNLTFYIFGLAFSVSEEFWTAVDNYKRSFLLLGIPTSITIIVMRIHLPEFSTPSYTVPFTVFAILFGLNTWFLVVAILGFARKNLSKTNRFLQYFSRGSYPFYIIHLVLMAVLGSYIVQWRMGILVEFIMFTILSFIVTIVVYDAIIKRTKTTRFLFGLKA